jgi:RHS repeat-associated protein
MINAGAVRVPEGAGFDPRLEMTIAPQLTQFQNTITTHQDGYMYVWVSNESENTKVWFDDLKVTHVGSPIVGGADYYPFGMPISDREILDEKYRYGYQGEYAEKDLETGWNHFELREYDAIIGRWLIPDPNREFWSPYVAYGNDPVNTVDPRGGFTDPKPGDLNTAGTQQWGLNGTTGEYGWSDILSEVTVTAPLSLTDNVSGYRGADIAAFSEGRTGWYLRGSGVANVRPIPQNPTKGTSLYDCSGWVSYCVGQYHPELAKKLGGGTGDYEYYANKEGGLRTSTEGLQVGDLALWKGHAAIVTAVHGTGFTISHSSGKDGITKVPKSTQFDGLSDPQLKRYGSNGGAGKGIFVGFWTPQIPIGGSR